MPSDPKPTQQNIVAIIFFLYLFPVLLLTVYSLGSMPPNSSWSIFAIGLFGGAAGSLVLYWLLDRWSKTALQVNEQPVYSAPLPIPLVPTAEQTDQSEHSELLGRIQSQSDDLLKVRKENEQCQQRVQQALNELETYKNRSLEELQRRE